MLQMMKEEMALRRQIVLEAQGKNNCKMIEKSEEVFYVKK